MFDVEIDIERYPEPRYLPIARYEKAVKARVVARLLKVGMYGGSEMLVSDRARVVTARDSSPGLLYHLEVNDTFGFGPRRLWRTLASGRNLVALREFCERTRGKDWAYRIVENTQHLTIVRWEKR